MNSKKLRSTHNLTKIDPNWPQVNNSIYFLIKIYNHYNYLLIRWI